MTGKEQDGSFEKRKADGFTLLELIIVIFIVGIISGISAPYLGGYYRAMRIKVACREIASVMRYAQSEAVFSGIPDSVYFDLDHNVYYLVKYNGRTEGEEGAPLKVKIGTTENRLLPDGVLFDGMDEGRNDRLREGIAKVRFHPDGTVWGGTIWLKDDRNHRLGVCIHPTGRTEVIVGKEAE